MRIDQMNKQNQGSKKKARKVFFLKRQEKRNNLLEKQRKYDEAMNSGNLQTMADAMGIKLK